MLESDWPAQEDHQKRNAKAPARLDVDEQKDCYVVLGVSRDANEEEIKKTDRRLARQHHPDANPSNQQAEARLKEINEAQVARPLGLQSFLARGDSVMLDQTALQELVGFQAASKDNLVLSVYLDVDPRHRATDEYRLALRHLLESVEGQTTREDRARVEQYVEKEFDRQSRGLACFSNEAQGFWQVHPMMVPVQDTVFVGLRPYVKPLSDVLSTFARYGVVLVDKEGGHLFLFHMGNLEGVSGVAGEDIKRHKQGGRAAARYQRREDTAIYRNLKEAAEMTNEFVRSGQVRRLILGGTDENVAQFASLLPKGATQAVVGTISADVNASPGEVGEKSLALIKEIAATQNAALVDQLITIAAKEGPAVVGLAGTLRAVDAGQALHVLMADDLAATAYRCDHCGYVGVEATPGCPSCGRELRELPDAADSLMRWAIGQGIDLTVVADSAKLKEAGSIGALLRY